MVEEFYMKQRDEWNKTRRLGEAKLEKLGPKALKLDRRFTKNWEKNLRKFEDKRNGKNSL